MARVLDAYNPLHGPTGAQLLAWLEPNLEAIFDTLPEGITSVANTSSIYTGTVEMDDPYVEDKSYWFTPHVPNAAGAGISLNGDEILPLVDYEEDPIAEGALDPSRRYLLRCTGESFVVVSGIAFNQAQLDEVHSIIDAIVANALEATDKVLASTIGIAAGDTTLLESANQLALDAFFASSDSINTTLVFDLDGTVRLTNIVVPVQRHMVGLGHLARTTLKFGGLSAPGIKTQSFLNAVKDFILDSTPERIAADAADAHGIQVGEFDSSSVFGVQLENLRISNQPGAGVRGYGAVQSGEFHHVETRGNGEGWVWTASTANQPFGQCHVNYLRSSNNRGPGLHIGEVLSSAAIGYRWKFFMAELNDNSWDPAACPTKQSITSGMLGSASPLASLNTSVVLHGNTYGLMQVHIPAHACHKGDWVFILGATSFGDWVAATHLNIWHQVYRWIDDDHFEVLVPGLKSAAATGGGSAITMTVRPCTNAWVRADNCIFELPAFGNSVIGGAHDTEELQAVETRGLYLHDSRDITLESPRFIEIEGGVELDSAGTASSGAPTSLSDRLYCRGWRAIDLIGADGTYLFIIPQGAKGCILEGPEDTGGHDNVVYCRDIDNKFFTNNLEKRSVASELSPQTLYSINYRARQDYTIAAGVIHIATDLACVLPQSGTTDDLDSIFIGSIVPPFGTEITIYNPESANIITLTSAGNISLPSGHTVWTLRAGRAVRLISNGVSWRIASTSVGLLSSDAGTFSSTGATNGTKHVTNSFDLSTAVDTIYPFLRLYNPNGQVGNISTLGSATQFNTTSDERLKEAIGPMSGEEIDDLLRSIDVKKFRWLTDQSEDFGPFAQELYGILPKVVNQGGDDPKQEPWTWDRSQLVPYLIRGWQRLDERISALEQE